MAPSWFPTGRNDSGGWRLDIVSLLAVIGESSIEGHSQALTSSWTAMLPRIIPAPQALLKPSRPTRMPQVNAAVVGVHNGTLVPTLNYFPNIIHPIEELPAYAFKVYHITRKSAISPRAATNRPNTSASSTAMELEQLENGQAPRPPRHRSTFRELTHIHTDVDKPKPRVPSRSLSPLNILSMLSFILTVGLVIWAALIRDGTACVALASISLVSSIVGYASWWSPLLSNRTSHSKVPDGDVVIRTREGAFILVKCNEDVARELYTGTEECTYYVNTQLYRILVAFGTFMLMISVVLLGNCGFTMQAAIGASYIVLNGAFWATSLFNKDLFWDLSNYEWVDVTPPDAQGADIKQDDTDEGKPSFTRTMWYAIRETKKIGWVKRGGAAPMTPEWDEWLKAAEENATQGNRLWNAVYHREQIVGLLDSIPQAKATAHLDNAEQHAPAFEVPPPSTR